VDTRFANSGEATRTQTESEYMKAFVAQFADVGLIVRLVVGAAFVTILMIVANTMVFAIRERRREIGVMKVLGFSDGTILRGVLAETALLFALGLGIGMILAAIALIVIAAPLAGIAPGMALDPILVLQAIGLAAALAILTGALPAVNALRIPPAAALKGA
jgi:putative ABC transport system permease protein